MSIRVNTVSSIPLRVYAVWINPRKVIRLARVNMLQINVSHIIKT